MAHGGLVSPVLFSLYVNDMPKPPATSELALYADETALKFISRSPQLLARYLQTYLNGLDIYLRDCKIAINISKSPAVLFAKTARPSHPSPSESQYNGLKQQDTLG
jgi:hypothetical protein